MQRVIALFFLITSLPLLFLLLLLSLLTQGRPLFFLQERVGKKRIPFKIYKLRTMNDQRVTPFGRFLRKTGLDELPQLINIIRGEMLFIGPRPLLESDIIRLGWGDRDHDIRWSVFPGITGPSQLSNICTKENSWTLDSAYCQNQGVREDCKILGLTLWGLLRGRSEVR